MGTLKGLNTYNIEYFVHNHGKFPNKTLIEIISVYLNFSHNFTNIIRKQTTGFQHDIQYLSQE